MNVTPRTPESGVLPCLFDRIVRSLGRHGTADSRSIDPRLYRDAVRRDLEWLLNARRKQSMEEMRQAAHGFSGASATDLPATLYDHEEVPSSVLNYGIRDINGVSLGRNDQAILSEIQEAIRGYEPRIVPETLRIERIGVSGGGARLAFSIEAELWALPGWEPLRIDIDLTTGSCRVEEGGEA